MIDKLFSIVLILNATGLFSFIAPQVSVTIGQVSLVLLCLNILYLLSKTKYLLMIVRRRWMKVCLFVILVWPLFTIIYAPSIDVRTVGLQLYYVTLFLCSVVYTVANGLPAIHRLVTISLFISILGLVMSMIAPQYFEQVSQLAEAETFYHGRAFGFFLQPNQLALALVLLFIGSFSLWQRKNTVFEILAVVAFIAIVFFTGSRASILVAAFVGVLIYFSAFQRDVVLFKSLLKIGVLTVCLTGVIIGAKISISNLDYANTSQLDLTTRMEIMLSFRLTQTSNILDEISIKRRLMAQEIYWSLFKEKPVWGHGFGSDVHYFETGHIFLTAHSDALTKAMEYGALYPIAFSLMMFHLFVGSKRRNAEKIFQTNSIFQFVFAALSFFLFTGGLGGSRTFYVIWGMVFAALYYPKFVFNDTQRPHIIGSDPPSVSLNK